MQFDEGEEEEEEEVQENVLAELSLVTLTFSL